MGRWLRRHYDRLQAENLYYLFSATTLAVLVFAGFIAWAILEPMILHEPRGQVAAIFFGLQAGLILVFVAGFVIGFRPSLEITVSGRSISLKQGAQQVTLRASDIEGIDTVDARTYHRVHRTYAGIVEFSGAHAGHYLLLRLPRRTVALGLPDDIHGILHT